MDKSAKKHFIWAINISFGDVKYQIYREEGEGKEEVGKLPHSLSLKTYMGMNDLLGRIQSAGHT